MIRLKGIEKFYEHDPSRTYVLCLSACLPGLRLRLLLLL